MKEITFTKMAASGNDFIVMDNRASEYLHLSRTFPETAKILCERRFSVGADGMLVIESSKRADFKMRIFNPDGSEAEMCGNGLRCAALYAVENGIAQKDMKIETLAGIIDAEVIGLRVKLKLTDPKAVELNKKITIAGKAYRVHFINTGVPHAVVFVDNIDKVNVAMLGRNLRFHKAFKPGGANADFVKVLNAKEIKIRTYERGVEEETHACGTGAAASALASNLIYGLKPHIDVITRSGETLRVYFDVNPAPASRAGVKAKRIRNVYLEGEAKVVYKGVMNYV